MTWLSTLRLLTETGPELHNVQSLGEERRYVDADAAGVKKLPQNDCEVYFTPGFLPQDILKAYMDAAQISLDIAVHAWTLPSLADAVIQTSQRLRGHVRVIMDKDQGPAPASVLYRLVEGGITAVLDQHAGVQKNRYMIVDAKAVVYGSYDWCTAAASLNRESFVVIKNEDAVKSFKENFEEIWRGNKVLGMPA